MMVVLDLVLAIVLAVASAGPGNRRIEEKPPSKKEDLLLTEYFRCGRELKTPEDIRAQKSCVFSKVYSSAENSRKERLAAWLVMKPELKKIRPCGPEDDLRIQGFPEKTDSISCFEFTIGGEEKTGFAFFKQDSKKQLGFYSLHY